jgi:hypothetical protein
LALAFLIVSCTRYEWRNELDAPGRCPPRRDTSKISLIRFHDADLAGLPGTVTGHVTERVAGTPLTGAHVRLAAGVETYAATTDASGSFRFDSVSPGRYLVEVQRIAYESVHDTITVAPAKPLSFDGVLVPAVLDGPCSGFMSVRVRKPWWKFW